MKCGFIYNTTWICNTKCICNTRFMNNRAGHTTTVRVHTWTTNSQTIRASSASVYGPYVREDVQIGIWSHEAAVTRGPNGEYVAFFSYNKNPGSSRPVCNTCKDGSTPESCKKGLVAPMIENTDPSYAGHQMLLDPGANRC